MTKKREMHRGFLGERSADRWKFEGKSQPLIGII
jgi:hypothetical protein